MPLGAIDGSASSGFLERIRPTRRHADEALSVSGSGLGHVQQRDGLDNNRLSLTQVTVISCEIAVPAVV